MDKDAKSSASASSDAIQWLPSYLKAVERGSFFVRRINSDRIAQDPRLNVTYTTMIGQEEIDDSSAAQEDLIDDIQSASQEDEEKLSSTQVVDSDENRLDTSMTCDQSDDEGCQAKSNVTSPNRFLSWTYRFQSTLQNSIQAALFAKSASENSIFISVAPRIFSLSPWYMKTFERLFTSRVSPRHWNSAVKLLSEIDATIQERFGSNACVFDCGLFDGTKTLLDKSLVYDDFCDGRVASVAFDNSYLPAMQTTCIMSSAVSAWLALDASNVAILIASSNETLSLYASCCAIYCCQDRQVQPDVGLELYRIYHQHIRAAESWPSKLQRTLTLAETRNVYYFNHLPRPQARFVMDFADLLDWRDVAIERCVEREMIQSADALCGCGVIPAPQALYISELILVKWKKVMPKVLDDIAESKSSEVQEKGEIAELDESIRDITYRPYFVIQNERGILYSSLICGVRDIAFSGDPHSFVVDKTLDNCTDLCLKMYHLPYGRQGRLLCQFRLHTSLLLERQTPTIDGNGSYETTFSLFNGDFDCISNSQILPPDFAICIRYARCREDFPELPDEEIPSHEAALRSGALPSFATLAERHIPWNSVALNVQKEERYCGPPSISFPVNQQVHSLHGDVNLKKIDAIRRSSVESIELFIVAHVVNLETFECHLVPFDHLFDFALPDNLASQLLDMGATQDCLQSLRDESILGFGMTFDERYARWLQQLYDSDASKLSAALSIHTRVFNVVAIVLGAGELMIDPETETGIASGQIPPTAEFRICIITTDSLSAQRSTRGSLVANRGRGASMQVLQQLPTYKFEAIDAEDSKFQTGISPDCLICRDEFQNNDLVKSLPCFHSYHDVCIDAWLSLNKVCPVCQHSVDHMAQ